MSAADKHRTDAIESLSQSLRVTCADPGTGYAMQAAASALLAIEARLGELVDAIKPTTVTCGSIVSGDVDPETVAKVYDRIAQETRLRSQIPGATQ